MKQERITDDNFKSYLPYIPAFMLRRIADETVIGFGYIDDLYDNDVIGAALLCEVGDWLEIASIQFAPYYKGTEYVSDVIGSLVRLGKHSGYYKGIIAAVAGDDIAELEPYYYQLGFESEEHKEEAYDISIEDLKSNKLLHGGVKGGNAVYLKDAPRTLRNAVSDAIDKDDREIPFPSDINWDKYDGNISCIFTVEGAVKGLLLLKHVENSLVLSCAWAIHQVALPGMLCAALKAAEQQGDKYKTLIIPALNERSAMMVEKIVPTARRGIVRQETYRFEEPDEFVLE